MIDLSDMKISHLDRKNILWKRDGEDVVGKRCVITKDNRHVWLEETTPENVKYWLHGLDGDYKEKFIR